MDIYEFQAKRVFSRFGVHTSRGEVTSTAEGAGEIATDLGGGRVVVKAQVLTGGRGKAGGIKVADGPDEAVAAARGILGMDIRGHAVDRVLVEPAADIARELYLGLTLDRLTRRAVIMASSEGGVDIEEVAATRPDAIHRLAVHPLVGLQAFQGRALGYAIGLPADLISPFTRVARGLYDAFTAWDATLAEINPLVITGENNLLALDAKMSLDNNALFRQAEAAEMRDPDAGTPAERAARAAGLSYVDLDGSIGCLVNGAGLAMATMDVIKFFGGEPANFLDIGGGAQADKVEAAMRIILDDPNVRCVLVNIFGGITRGDEVAKGLLAALDAIGRTDVPIVARIVGTNAEEGRRILADAQLDTGETLAAAAEQAVRLAEGQGVAA